MSWRDGQSDGVGNGRQQEADSHEQRAEVVAVVHEARAVETGCHDAQQAKYRDDDPGAPPGDNRENQQHDRPQEQRQPDDDMQQKVQCRVAKRPDDALRDPYEVIICIGSRMHGGNLDKQIDQHPHQELRGQQDKQDCIQSANE